ncbi:MAG: PhzF family phenazine biosynthesis protein [Candidatus Thorarchaeota archaeon]
MKVLPYVQTSVFIDDRYAFGGNQLATFWDIGINAQISSQVMQGIAREMNFSETTFLANTSLKGCAFKVRIFTPAKEIPFAGHPTLGTAFVIKHVNLLGSEITTVNLELGIGKIPVEYVSANSIRMIQPKPRLLKELTNLSAIAETVGLPVSAISTEYPTQYVQTGSPFLIVPLNSLDAIQKAQPDGPKILATLKDELTARIVLLTTDTEHPDSDIHVRMFAPDVGVLEDPATGSAAGPVGAYVEHYNLLNRANPGERIFIEQGYEIQRPSQLIAEVVGGKIPTNVLVSGKVKLVAEGQFYVSS